MFYFSSSSSDVDECSSNSTNPCQFACINTLGSYKCECPVGYHLSADGKKCQGWLFAIYNKPCNKDLFLLQELCVDDAYWKHNANVSNFAVVNPVLKTLKRNYLDRGPCLFFSFSLDIDECALTGGPCSQNQCYNTRGSYQCLPSSCPQQYNQVGGG